MAEGEQTVGDLAASPAEETTSPVVEQEQVSQTTEQGTPPTTPSETPVVQDPPFHTHPRWIERQREVEALRQQNQQLLDLAQRQVPVQTAQDPWEPLLKHQDPATAQFYAQQRALMQQEAYRAAQAALGQIAPLVQMGRQELAQMTIAQFRQENPDIKPGSEEEGEIARLVAPQDGSRGLTLEQAKRVVMYDKVVSKITQATQAQQAQRSAQKRVTTPEASQGMPASAGGPQTVKSFRDTLDAELRREGL